MTSSQEHQVNIINEEIIDNELTTNAITTTEETPILPRKRKKRETH